MKRNTAIALILALVLPALVGLVVMWSMSQRADRLTDVPAAVVNADQMVTAADGSIIYGGRLVASELTSPATQEDSSLGFVLTDADDAATGLANGTYFAVVTIPSDFSATLAGISTADPSKAQIQIESNDASSPLLGLLTQQLGDAATRAIGQRVTAQFVGGMLDGMTVLAGRLNEAASGASALAGGLVDYTGGVAQSASGASALAGGLSTAADGASDLAGGITDLASGASQLSSGAHQSASGAAQLASGTFQLADGAGQLSSGAAALSANTPALASGASGLSGGLATLDASMPALVSGASALSGGAAGLSGGIAQAGAGASQLAGGLATFDGYLTTTQAGIDSLPVQFGQLQGGAQAFADQVAAGSNATLADFLTAVATQCRADSATGVAPDAYCADLPAVQQSLATQQSQLAAGTQQIADGIALAVNGDGTATNPGLTGLAAGFDRLVASYQNGDPATGQPGFVAGAQALADGINNPDPAAGLAAGAAQLASGASELSSGISTLASNTPALAAGASQLASGTQQLADGASQLASGASGVASGAAATSDGASALAGGLGQLADGTASLTTGATTAAAGAGALASGVGLSADGASQLAGGLGQLDANSSQLTSGASDLASGLADGVAQIPTYTDAQVSQISDVAAEPVAATTTKLVTAEGGGTAVAGLVLALGLWFGAFATYLVLQAVPRRALAAPISPLRTALIGLRNGLLLAVAQGVLAGIVLPMFDIVPVNPIGAAIVAVVAALSFAALHQGIIAAFGRRVGAIASVLFLVVQVAALGVVIPVQTAPSFLQAIAAFAPLNNAANLLQHMIVGGSTVSVGAGVAVLVAWLAVGVALATMAASRRKQTTLGALRADVGAAA